MKQIPVKLLQAGSMYTEPVYIEENNLLVPARIVIRKKDIERLISWGVDTVQTDGEITSPDKEEKPLSKAEVLENTKFSTLSSLVKRPETEVSYRVYIGLIDQLNDIFNYIADGNRIDVHSVDTIIDRLIQEIRDQRECIIGYILSKEIVGRDFAKAAVNTAILAYLISMEFKAPNQKLLQIVTGALLHDVGMLRLPREIFDKKGGLSEDDLRQIQTHPPASYKIACKELLYSQGVGLVVLQHHEHWDGSGYPQRLAGTKIDAGARIVSVADAFEAMVTEKPYRDSMIGYQAMKNLMADNSRCFDPHVLKAFVKTMGLYPIGSYILLNNGAIARITEVRMETPLRPKISLLIDESGKAYPKKEGRPIDLGVEKNLFIVRALDPKEFAKKHE
ncbi:MAG: HD-GYP domain-containing protein [Treponema sp.]|jgi:HD-GYP domain-containing protein (c-di-GMP phosphodiesterase class II)|nr:HD-GYP domain-containing protein [Treponema sp.]